MIDAGPSLNMQDVLGTLIRITNSGRIPLKRFPIFMFVAAGKQPIQIKYTRPRARARIGPRCQCDARLWGARDRRAYPHDNI